MYLHKTTKRVRYSETDKMGYLYYGNYAMYFEIGRVEAMRALGMTYRELEDDYKVMMPVMSYTTRYLRPAYYDDLIEIHTRIRTMPERSIKFEGELYNEKNELINAGSVVLAFVSMEDNKRIDAPAFFKDLLKPYFND